jgi:hypothetical protein
LLTRNRTTVLSIDSKGRDPTIPHVDFQVII